MTIVHEGSWLGLDWDAITAIVTIVAVLVAGFGSYFAWSGVQAQIIAARKQHQEVLSAARRPFLVLREIVVDPHDSNFLPQGNVANIGVGPAIAVSLDVWFHPSTSPGLRAATLDREMVAEAGATRASRRPDARGLPGSIAAGASNLSFDVNALTERLNLTVPPDHQLLVTWQLTYHDLDKAPYSNTGTTIVRDREGSLITHDQLSLRNSEPATM